MMDWSAWVGLPWRDRGRDAVGYDCWGLLRAAFQAGTGIELPSHDGLYASSADRAETASVLAGEIGDWSEIARGGDRAFDAAVMRIAGGYHVGLIVRRGLLLHMPRGKSSVIEPLSRFTAVLAGLYRHRELAGR